MIALRIAAVATASLCVPRMPAQVHMPGRGGIGGGMGNGVDIGRPLARPSMPFRNGSFHHSSFSKQHGSGFGFAGLDSYFANGPFFDPFYGPWYADYGTKAAYSSPAQPSVVVMMPQLQIVPPSAPPPSIRPEVREYNWPASNPGAPAAFVLVYKDRRVESALAVTLDGSRILYITPDGSHKQMSMEMLDRDRTRQRNAERQLKLPWLGLENS